MTIISTWTPPSQIIAGISNANPGVVTTAQTNDFLTGLFVRLVLPGNFGMPEVNENVYEIEILSPNTFSIPVDTTNFTPFASGSASITNIINGSPTQVFVSADNFTVNQAIFIQGVNGVHGINNLYFKVIGVGPGFIFINYDSTHLTFYGSGGVISPSQLPQVIPVAENADSLLQAERNSLPPSI